MIDLTGYQKIGGRTIPLTNLVASPYQTEAPVGVSNFLGIENLGGGNLYVSSDGGATYSLFPVGSAQVVSWTRGLKLYQDVAAPGTNVKITYLMANNVNVGGSPASITNPLPTNGATKLLTSNAERNTTVNNANTALTMGSGALPSAVFAHVANIGNNDIWLSDELGAANPHTWCVPAGTDRDIPTGSKQLYGNCPGGTTVTVKLLGY